MVFKKSTGLKNNLNTAWIGGLFGFVAAAIILFVAVSGNSIGGSGGNDSSHSLQARLQDAPILKTSKNITDLVDTILLLS